MEPFFSVLLSALFLGESPSAPVLLSLLPIVGGVALASASEVTFNWPGFLAAMGSNVTFQSRNVFSKKFMGKSKARARALWCAAARCAVLQEAHGQEQGTRLGLVMRSVKRSSSLRCASGTRTARKSRAAGLLRRCVAYVHC